MKTFVKQTYPWGLFTKNGHRLLCSDGVIRAATLASTADTFFSVPASIRVKGKYITGYYTTDEYDGKRINIFRHHTVHSDKLPKWPESFSKEYLNLMSIAA